MTTATRPRRTADPTLDEAIERLQILVSAVLAVRAEHLPTHTRGGLLRRREARVCRCCHAAFPCRTVQALHASRVAGT